MGISGQGVDRTGGANMQQKGKGQGSTARDPGAWGGGRREGVDPPVL